GLRALQHGERLDVLRIQVGGAVGEINAAVAERRHRALIGREHASIGGTVVDRQAFDDDQRRVAAAARADPADGEGWRRRESGRRRRRWSNRPGYWSTSYWRCPSQRRSHRTAKRLARS